MTTHPPALERYRAHERVAAELTRASDDELLDLLSDPRISEVGYATVRAPRGAGTVFAKLVPVTALELSPRHRGTTANMFELPAYYLYRLGSCGQGVWREIEAHRRANQWVGSAQWAGFPLLHHWRVLPVIKAGYDDRRSVEHWGDCPAIHRRVAAVNQATSSVVLFLEHFPLTLGQWFRAEMARTGDPVTLATATEIRLRQLLGFLHAQGVLHLDAHFENILTDGSELYLTDFGLSIARDFELSPDERVFFEEHQNFDVCTAINAVVHAVVTFYDPRSDWRQTLRELSARAPGVLDAAPADVRAYLGDRTPLALAVGELYRRLLADLTSPYPAAAFDELLAALPA